MAIIRENCKNNPPLLSRQADWMKYDTSQILFGKTKVKNIYYSDMQLSIQKYYFSCFDVK